MDLRQARADRRRRRRQHAAAVVRALAAVAAIFGGLRYAPAIDPGRTLGQCLQRIWQTQPGLPRAAILDIYQSADGYLWLGTQEGLVRFDGVQFDTIRHAGGISLERTWIQDLHEDSEHGLLIATDGAGLIRWRGGAAKRFDRAAGLPSDDVRAVATDRHGNVWVATAEGLARIDLRDRIARFDKQPELAGKELGALAVAPDGALWIGGAGNRLIVERDGKFSMRTLTAVPEETDVRALLCTAEGQVWAGTSDGLIEIDGEHQRWLTTTDGLPSDSIMCLAAGRPGALWIGTKDGFCRLLAGEFDSFTTRDGLSQSTVYAVCEDREGSLWVGTKHGLNQFVDRRTTLYTSREGLPSNEAGPVLQDGSGDIWVGTLSAGLGRFDGRRFSVLTTADGLASDTILTLAAGDGDALWVGTSAGLNLLREGRVERTVTTADGLPSDVVRSLCRDHAGQLWVGTAGGIAVERGERFERAEGGPPPPTSALVEHRPGEIVAAVEAGGLYRWNGDRFEAMASTVPGQRYVDTLFRDGDQLWAGTLGHGLLLFDGERSCQLTTKNGLYDDDIFGIVADDQDRLWLACSKGIFFVTRTQLRSFATGKLKSVDSTPFSPMDALRIIECRSGVQPSVWKMRDGRIWFSTIRGLILIDSNHLERVIPPMPVAVEEVIVDGKSEDPRQVSGLPPGVTNLEFRYTALSFVAPTRTTFRYRLEGFDPDWVDAGSRREAFYTNLSPGDYRFRVAARPLDGAWQEAQVVSFRLEPYFYQTRWFVPLCGSLVLLAGWALYRLRVRRIKEQLRIVLAERSRIARELHDTLMQGFSGVTMEMQALSARLSPSAERQTLEEIIRDAGVCLREARRSVAGLRRPRTGESGLPAAIAQAARQLTETHDVRLKLEMQGEPPALSEEVQYNLLRIAQEAVTNAVKHSGGRNIEVGLRSGAQRLELSVADDGAGFGAQDGARASQGHYGLIGMRERASQIGAAIDVDSQPGRGTTIVVRLPLDRAEPPEPSSAGRNGVPGR